MDLGYELSKFKRNDVAIIDYISRTLGLKLEPLMNYINFGNACDSLKDCISGHIIPPGFEDYEYADILHTCFTSNNKNYDILIYLPAKAEVYLKYVQESINLHGYIDNIDPCFIEDFYNSNPTFNYSEDNRHKDIISSFLHILFGDEANNERFVLLLGYEKFMLLSNIYNSVSIEYDYDQLHNIKKFIESGYDKDLNFVFQYANTDLPLSDYVLDRDSYISSIRNSLVDSIATIYDEHIKNDFEEALCRFDNFINSVEKDELDSKIIKYLCGDSHKNRLELIKSQRISSLDNWGTVLVNDSDIVSIEYCGKCLYELSLYNKCKKSQSSIPYIINIVKDLPKLLWQIYWSEFDGKPSDICTLVPGYFSTSASDFRKPYDIHDGLLFADGNLSKVRAVKKFVEAVKLLGLNLSDFKIVIK